MKDWPTFKTAVQVKSGDNIIIRDIRAPNLNEAMALLRRLTNLSNLDTLTFLEVHHVGEGGLTEVVVGAPDQVWPKNVPTEKHTVVYSPRVPGTAPHPAPFKITDADNKERTAVVVGPIGPEPQPVPLNIIQALSAKAKERRAKAAAENVPKESFRPVRIHKREVA
jgi:hypothetical protein